MEQIMKLPFERYITGYINPGKMKITATWFEMGELVHKLGVI